MILIIPIENTIPLPPQTDWANLIVTSIVTIVSSILGAGAAVYVLQKSIRAQKIRDNEQFDNAEKSKLKYLHFLLQDAFHAVDTLISNYQSFPAQFNHNPLRTPNIHHHPAISLHRIANRINQDEYYHASVNQIHSDEVAEIFILIDILDQALKNSMSHIDESRSRAMNIGDRLNDFYQKALNETKELIEEIDSLSLNNQNSSIKERLKEFVMLADYEARKGMADDNWSYVPIQEVFVNPALELLSPYTNIDQINKVLESINHLSTTYKGIISINRQLLGHVDEFVNRISRMRLLLIEKSAPLAKFANENL